MITNASYGTTLYAFSVLLGEAAAAGEFGRALLSGALGLGVVVSGVLAPIVGTLCDVLGSRWVFFTGAVLGSMGLAAFSRVTEGWQVLAAWALLIGPAMACTLYEPAYVTIDQWFAGRNTGTAIGVLTLVAGLSATIFIPLTQWLIEGMGWRNATLAECLPSRGRAALTDVSEAAGYGWQFFQDTARPGRFSSGSCTS